jgi:Ca2+-binding EF-hand superfamily protein
MKNARTLFNEFDEDRSGVLDREEVAALFKSMGSCLVSGSTILDNNHACSGY